jgi:hypothetical protein
VAVGTQRAPALLAGALLPPPPPPLTSPLRSGTALASSSTPLSGASVSTTNGVPAGRPSGVVTCSVMVQLDRAAPAAGSCGSAYGAAQRTPNRPGHWRGWLPSSGMRSPQDDDDDAPLLPSPPQRPARSASVSARSEPAMSASAQ